MTVKKFYYSPEKEKNRLVELRHKISVEFGVKRKYFFMFESF